MSAARPGRVLALDLGRRRIGVAVCDPDRVMASPYATVERSGEPGRDHDAVAELVAEIDAAAVVVGLPVSLSGESGPAAADVEAEVAALRERLQVPVETQDERLTTVSAAKRMTAAGVAAKKQRRGGKIDQEAAAVILQSWLDSRRSIQP